jgi:hypothetical protein
MGTTSTITCDGCQVTLDPKKPGEMWFSKLPLPSEALTEEEVKSGKKRLKYSIDHAVLCSGCTEKVGDLLVSLKPTEAPAAAE